MMRHLIRGWFLADCTDSSWHARWFVLLAWIVGGNVDQLSAEPPEKDVVLDALGDEIQRSMKLRLGDLESPYFIQYAVDDTTNHRLSATCGALVNSTRSRSRTLHAQVRVGSYELDNSNFAGRGGFGFARGLGGSAELPTDLDYAALRHAVWIATDTLYKNSVATLAQKRAYLRDRNSPDPSSDFIKIETPTTSIQASAAPLSYNTAWEDYVRTISKTFVAHSQIQDSEVMLSVGTETRYLVNSEGSRLRYPDNGALLRITADTQADDGERLSDSLSYFVRMPEQLPELSKVLDDVQKFSERLVGAVQAPILDDYTGPVLVDGLASSQLIRQLLAQSLTVQVDPVGLQRRGDALDDLESRLGKRILPADFRIYDDPRQVQYESTFLAGHYLFDDEGIPPERVDIIVDGKLESMATSRTTEKPFVKSNGHGRRGSGSTASAAIGCLYVEASKGESPLELKKELIDAADAEGLKFGLRITSLQNRSGLVLGGFAGGFGRRGGGPGGGVSVGDPIAIYKVYVEDGREEAVRGCRIDSLDMRSLRRIIAAGKTQTVYNTIGGGSPASSVIAPALLFEELELSRIKQESERKPLLPAPHARPRPSS